MKAKPPAFLPLLAVTLMICVTPWAFPDARAAERILLIGDSHTVGTFGETLDRLLRQRAGAPEVETRASCGSSPDWWFTGRPTTCGYFFRDVSGDARRGLESPTPLLEILMKEHSPTLTVIALGANLVNAPLDHVERTSRQMAGMASSSLSRCVWIGPPHGRNKPEPGFSEFYEALKRSVTPECEFIDSRPYAHYPDQGGDGIHYDHLGAVGRAIARRWAEAVHAQIR